MIRRFAAALLCAFAATFALVAPSAHAEPSPAEPMLALTVDSITPLYLTPSESLTITGTVHNTGPEAIAAPTVTVLLDRTLLKTRSSLTSWLDPTSDDRGKKIATATLADLPAGSSATFDLTITPSSLGLNGYKWGARALAVVADSTDAEPAQQRTAIVWCPANGAPEPTQVAVLAPVTGPTADPATGRVSPEDVATALAPSGRLGSLVTAATGAEISWGVDPSLLTSVAAVAADPEVGSDLAATANSWLSAFATLTEDRFVGLLPYYDADVVALANSSDTIASDDLFRQSTDAAAALPAQLSDGLATAPLLTWPDGGQGDVRTVESAASDTPSTLILTESDSQQLTRNDTSTAPTYTPNSHLVLTQPGASPQETVVGDARLSSIVDNAEGLSPTLLAQRLLAETAIVANEQPSMPRSVLATVNRDWSPDAEEVLAVTQGLTAPWVGQVPLGTVLGATPDPTVTVTVPSRAESTGMLDAGSITQIVGIRPVANVLAKIFAEPYRTEFAQRFDSGLPSLLAVAWRSDPNGRSAQIDAAAAEIDATSSGIGIVTASTPFVPGSATDLPVTLHNGLDQPVTIGVFLEPRKAGLAIVENPAAQLVEPGETITVRVPVKAFGSGLIPVDAYVMNPDSVPITGTQVQFDVRVNASIESWVLSVAAILLGIVLILGIMRTIRRGVRRDGSRRTKVSAS